MNALMLLILIILLTSVTVVPSQENRTLLIEQYVKLVKNRTEQALKYEFPKNAKMYEAGNKTSVDFGHFDFIVIGAGTAGCVIANRLSEFGKWKILLLEAGTYPDDELTGIPALWITDSFSKFNWGFESIPQKYACLGNPEQKCPVPRGKGIGGSSLINGVVYTRGKKIDYDRWAALVNDSKWNYNNVLPYFKKAENFTKIDPYAPIDTNYHGYKGPYQVTQGYPPQNISATILEAFRNLGYNITDYNGKQQLGGSIFQYYTKDGRRFNPEMAYIAPAKKRDNLIISDKSFVTKIVISKLSKKVKGVIFTKENKTYIAKIRKEVILCAGVISSPQILMLSGIGPREHLESLGIEVVQDLPVGKQLREHALAPLVFSSNVSISESLEKSVNDFLNGQGSLTRSVSFDSVGWFKTPSEQVKNYPNMEFIFINISNAPEGQRIFGWSNETYNVLNAQVPNPFTLMVSALHTKSTGSVRLKSASPFDYPLIDPNLLSDSNNEDIETLYEGVQLAQKLLQTQEFRGMNVTWAFNDFPGCGSLERLSKQSWYCYFRNVTVLNEHLLGSCLTGNSSKTGVVDNNLRVFGINGLRVADGSIIPFPISGHTNAVCAMVGEKASDIIKEAHISVSN